MSGEKDGYRDMLSLLMEKYPLTLSKAEAAAMLRMSLPTLREAIKNGKLKIVNGKIPIGSIASYLCG